MQVAAGIWTDAPEADYSCGHANCLTKGSYRMEMHCGNCGARFLGRFTKGHDAKGERECSRCGCKTATSQRYVG